MIGIIDYGAGNLHSVEKAVKAIGWSTKLIARPEDCCGVNKLIFPGVGNARKTMELLDRKGLSKQIKQAIQEGIPFLGICLGMQLLMEFSEEDHTHGLGIFEGRVRMFQAEVKAPHMGWNEVHHNGEHPIFEGIPDKTDFYFVHSYYVEPNHFSNSIGVTHHGNSFCSVIANKQVMGVQFHPEKSAEAGLCLLQNFCNRW